MVHPLRLPFCNFLVKNSKHLNIPSYTCKVNDVISVSDKSRNFVKKLFENNSLKTKIATEILAEPEVTK